MWKPPWIPVIFPAVFGIWGLIFTVIATVEIVAGEPEAWVGLFLAGVLFAPAVWMMLHPFIIRRYMRRGQRQRVTVYHRSEGPKGILFGLFAGQPLTLVDASGQAWSAAARQGSTGGNRGFDIRGNPWLHPVPEALSPSHPCGVPGELVGPVWTGWRGLILHRPSNAALAPIHRGRWPTEELSFGRDPGVCRGIYLRRKLRPAG